MLFLCQKCFDSVVGQIEESFSHVNTVTIRVQSQTPDCVVTTRRGRVTIHGATNQPTAADQPSSSALTNTLAFKYNLLDHLGKTPAQITILELLHTSLLHKEILDKALMETQVPTDINVEQFQAMVAHLATPHSHLFRSFFRYIS